MNTQIIKVLFFDSIKKEYRSKALLILFIISLGYILLVNTLLGVGINYVSDFWPDFENSKHYLLTFIYSFLHFWAIFLALILGINSVSSDREKGVIGLILTAPIFRLEYLLARIMGAMAIVCLYFLGYLFLALLLFRMTIGINLFGFDLLFLVFNSLLIFLTTIVVSVFISLYWPKLISFLLSGLTLFLIKIANFYVPEIVWNDWEFGIVGFFAPFFTLIHWLLPQTGHLSQLSSDFMLKEWGRAGAWQWSEIMAYPHYLLTMILLIYLLNLSFQKRDL